MPSAMDTDPWIPQTQNLHDQYQHQYENQPMIQRKRRRDETISLPSTDVGRPLGPGHHMSPISPLSPPGSRAEHISAAHFLKGAANAPRRILACNKRMRVGSLDSSQPQSCTLASPDQQAFSLQKRSSVHQDAPAAITSAKITPCHVCHRRPTKKSDLENFMDCHSCGLRACYVCMRRCAGWLTAAAPVTAAATATSLFGSETSVSVFAPPTPRDDIMSDVLWKTDTDASSTPTTSTSTTTTSSLLVGLGGGAHRGMVCSRCCVERGQDGDVVCLGCLAGMQGEP